MSLHISRLCIECKCMQIYIPLHFDYHVCYDSLTEDIYEDDIIEVGIVDDDDEEDEDEIEYEYEEGM